MNTTIIDFNHQQSAHCESGVTANLLSHYGRPVSEAMAFGIGQGLFFAYLPFIRVNKLPLTTYRCGLGGILKRCTKRLGITLSWRKFRSSDKAMNALDDTLAAGTPVGCRTGGYWLPYFPPAFRFHFNMHNLVVYGRNSHDYLISDPVFPEPVRCPRNDLVKARFAKGALAPKGTMYYVSGVSSDYDLPNAIVKGIRGVCRTMTQAPGSVIGVRAIGRLAKQLQRWPERLGQRKALLYLGQVIRMQEEIGTGGAGFRFMFAAFLQEAAELLDATNLETLSNDMTAAGDRWRDFAVMAGRNCKGRAATEESFDAMADVLRDCAAREKDIYKRLIAATPAKVGARK